MCASIGGSQPHPYYTLRLGGIAQCIRFVHVGDSPCLLLGGSAGELWLVSITTKRPLWTEVIHAGKAILQVEAVNSSTAITYVRYSNVHLNTVGSIQYFNIGHL